MNTLCRGFLAAGLSLALCGCFGPIRVPEKIKMTIIELPAKPELTGDSVTDVQLLGEHAMRLRNIIHQYNTLVAEHNSKL